MEGVVCGRSQDGCHFPVVTRGLSAKVVCRGPSDLFLLWLFYVASHSGLLHVRFYRAASIRAVFFPVYTWGRAIAVFVSCLCEGHAFYVSFGLGEAFFGLCVLYGTSFVYAGLL